MSTRYALGRHQGITEALVEALADYEAGPFSARERVALRLADRMYEDHHRVDDALWGAVVAEFGEPGALELTWVTAEFISLGKLIYILDIPYGAHTHP